MKRFRFRLGALERVRALKQRSARIDLARAVAELARAEQLVHHATREADRAAETELDEEHAREAESLHQLIAWREGLRRQVRQARDEQARVASDVTRHRTNYDRAARDYRLLQRLRERRHRRWLEELEREESRFLSDTHLARIVRERREP